MASVNLSTLTLLSQSAINLDNDFAELQRLRDQVERLAIDSDSGVDKGRMLLTKFGECGTRIGESIQMLARELDAARASAEKSAEIVSQRALDVQKRYEHTQTMMSKFQALVEKVNALTANVGALRKPAGEDFSESEKAEMPIHLSNLDERLAELVNSMVALKKEAADSNMKALEKDAHSLAQSMLVSRNKLSAFASQMTNVVAPTANSSIATAG